MTDLSCALILLIEDEVPMRKLLQSTLENHGYRTVDSATGKEGIHQARTRNPEVILLDLGLPDMDGLEVTKGLRSFIMAPIIVLSARGQEQDKVAALDAGANDYLTKPFSLPELLARIRVALRSAVQINHEQGKTSIAFGDMRLDLAARRLFRKNEEVHLSPIEFKLLTTLVRHAGEVVTQKTLLRETWGASYESRRGYVRVYMHSLRHKLEQDPARPQYLVNEPGVGYRLKVD